MKISTIVFDLGRTLIHFDFNIALMRVAEHSYLNAEEIEAAVYANDMSGPKERPDIIDRYEIGHISTENFFSELKTMLQFKGTPQDLEAIWCDIFTPLEEHIQLAKLLAEYYPLCLLSNTSEAHIRFVETKYDFMSIFRKRLYSYELGMLKPDPAIYHRTIEEMEADKFETLLIDDREENVVAASKLGWQTIHLRPEVSLKAALQSYELTGI